MEEKDEEEEHDLSAMKLEKEINNNQTECNSNINELVKINKS